MMWAELILRAWAKMMEDEQVVPFDPKGCRYDQSTYAGRLRRFREVTDPRMLLITDQELAKVLARPASRMQPATLPVEHVFSLV